MQGKSTQKQKRSTRNRNRSKRRAILCPVHTCHLESHSPKYKLAANQVNQLTVQVAVNPGAVGDHADEELPKGGLQGEWIERFWCPECKRQCWYHIKEVSPRCYKVELASGDLCQQVSEIASALADPSH